MQNISGCSKSHLHLTSHKYRLEEIASAFFSVYGCQCSSMWKWMEQNLGILHQGRVEVPGKSWYIWVIWETTQDSDATKVTNHSSNKLHILLWYLNAEKQFCMSIMHLL